MAANIPAKLRTADITRFAQRAGQVEKYKPPIAYWSYYYMVQQIISKGLHNQDEESKAYTSALMDKMEEVKAQNPSDDAIKDDMAGQAYIEQFGQETFERADSAMGANKASRQTADTFQAAGTFLDLVHIWGQPTPEITAQIKYAKFHALRIAKAVKAGEDPNTSNPAPIPAPEEEAMQLDPNDPEVLALTGHRPPRVEDAPDDTQRRMSASAGQSSFDQSLHPSRDSSRPRPPFESMWLGRNDMDHGVLPSAPASVPPHANGSRPISPMPPPSALSPVHDEHDQPISPSQYLNGLAAQPQPPNPRQNSVGEGYFPGVQEPEVPYTDAGIAPPHVGPLSPIGYISPATQHPSSSPRGTYNSQPQSQAPSASYSPPVSVPSPQPPTHQQPPAPQPPRQPPPGTTYQLPPNYQGRLPPPDPPYAYELSPQPQQPRYLPPPQPRPLPPQAAPPPLAAQSYVTDDVAMIDAQKHAKWAISALNFEDVPTAVKELRAALQSLGAV